MTTKNYNKLDRRIAGLSLTAFMLLGAALVGAVPTTVALSTPGPSCFDEDQTGGTGGQSVSCSFRCGSPNTISVFVEADDTDADVSGTADCGGVTAHCSGAGSHSYVCTDTDGPTSEEGDGSCSGDSDEMWDSGLYVECTAETVPVTGGGGVTPVPQYWCPVALQPNPPYPAVCFEGPPPNACAAFTPITVASGGRAQAVEVSPSRCEVSIDMCTLLSITDAIATTTSGAFNSPCSAPSFVDGQIITLATGASVTAMGYEAGQAIGITCHGAECSTFDPAVKILNGDRLELTS